MSKNTSITKGSKAQDNNSVVVTGAVINSAEVSEKRDQAVVLKYDFNGTNCTGVMHVSQFPSLDRHARDKMFAEVVVGDKFDGLETLVEPADLSSGRRFTSVRLSGRSPLVKAADTKRETLRVEREARETAYAEAVRTIDGTVLKATIKSLAFSRNPETKKETDHCYGAFLKTEIGGIEVSGLLHTSRMTGTGRIERLVASFEKDTVLEVVANCTDKGISFSEEDVKSARAKQSLKERAERQSQERDNFLGIIREALSAGTTEKTPFLAKVTENHLDTAGGVIAEACGARVVVSSEGLAIPATSLRGTGHQLKLVAISEQEGVVTAKRYIKGK